LSIFRMSRMAGTGRSLHRAVDGQGANQAQWCGAGVTRGGIGAQALDTNQALASWHPII
jgi:hypothetical protein